MLRQLVGTMVNKLLEMRNSLSIGRDQCGFMYLKGCTSSESVDGKVGVMDHILMHRLEENKKNPRGGSEGFHICVHNFLASVLTLLLDTCKKADG